MQVELKAFYVSPGHNFFGRKSPPTGEHPIVEPNLLQCRAGLGIEGDRFFGYRPDYKGQITFFSAAVLAELRSAMERPELSAAVLRRNVLLGGVDLAQLIGRASLPSPG